MMNNEYPETETLMMTGSPRYLLFVTTSAWDRRLFVSSFEDKEAALAVARKLKEDGARRWQVIDNRTNDVVAEDQAQ